jgi:hypothetical protein
MNEVGWRRGMFIRSKSHEEEEELFVFNFTTAGGSIQPGFNKRVVRSAVAVYSLYLILLQREAASSQVLTKESCVLQLLCTGLS